MNLLSLPRIPHIISFSAHLIRIRPVSIISMHGNWTVVGGMAHVWIWGQFNELLGPIQANCCQGQEDAVSPVKVSLKENGNGQVKVKQSKAI